MAEPESFPVPGVDDTMPAAAPGTSADSAARVEIVTAPTEDAPTEDAPRLRQQAPDPSKGTSCLISHSTGARNLVVCIDGTSNQFSTKNTNVVELYSRLIKDRNQLTFYNSGIGTYAKPSWKSLSYYKQVIANKFDLAFALRLEKIILSAYAWLVDNYEDGDRIFLFGFSRGAYQVRALAAMIETVGLLHKGNTDQISFAYELYAASGEDNHGSAECAAPAQQFWHPYRHKLHVIGESLKSAARRIIGKLREALPQGWRYDREMVSIGKTVMQATISLVSRLLHHRENQIPTFPRPTAQLRAERSSSEPVAMHEQFRSTFSRRVKIHFVGVWDTVSSVGLVRDKTLPSTTEGMKFVCFFRHALALHEYRVKFLPEYANGGYGPDPETPRNGFSQPHTKEVWFTGSHSDIGGGSTANTTLDQFGPALRWMSWEATLAGLRLNKSPRNWGSITVSDSMTATWRIIEFLPVKHLSYEEPENERRCLLTRIGLSGRVIPGRHQPVTWRPHFSAQRRIKRGQRIHQSVYAECGVFQLQEPVATEQDAHIEAVDILRPQKEVIQDGYLLDTRNTQRLTSVISTAEGTQTLCDLHLSQYIRDMELSCHSSEGGAQILEDLRTLYAAYVKAMANHRTALSSFATFPFAIRGHTGPVSSVAFLSDARLISGSWDKTLRIWDASTGEAALGSPVSGHTGGISCVAVHAAKGLVASASCDAIRLWTSDTNGAIHGGKVLMDERESVCSVAFSPDGSHLVSGSNVLVWDAATGRAVAGPATITDRQRNVAFSSDGKCIAYADGGGVVLLSKWCRGDVTLHQSRELSGHTNHVVSVTFSPDARVLATGSEDCTVRIWDVATGALKFTLKHPDAIFSVAFAPSGTHIVSGSSDWMVRIWNARTGSAVRVLRGHTGWVMSVAFSPDGRRIASGSFDETIRVWDFVPPPDESHPDEDL